MSLLLTTLLATAPSADSAPATPDPAPPAVTVYALGKQSGALRFQAFSRLTDPFGSFGQWQGKLTVPDDQLAKASLEVVVDIASISTNNAKRDAHLKNPDFFNEPKWPKAVFRSQNLRPLGGDRYSVAGTMEMMGRKVAISFPVTITRAGDQLSVKADFKIDRTQWGMTGYLKTFSINPIQKSVRVLFDLKLKP